MDIKEKIKKNEEFDIIDIDESNYKYNYPESDDNSDNEAEDDNVNESKEKKDNDKDDHAFSRTEWCFLESMTPKTKLGLCHKYLHIITYGCGMFSYTEFKIEIKKNKQLIYKFLNMLEYYKNKSISEEGITSDEDSDINDINDIDDIDNDLKKET
jgi:hypothetical protein